MIKKQEVKLVELANIFDEDPYREQQKQEIIRMEEERRELLRKEKEKQDKKDQVEEQQVLEEILRHTSDTEREQRKLTELEMLYK